MERQLRADLVRKDVYDAHRAADRDLIHEVRDDIAAIRSDVAEIKANDRKRIGVLVASLVIPLAVSLILLWVTVEVVNR